MRSSLFLFRGERVGTRTVCLLWLSSEPLRLHRLAKTAKILRALTKTRSGASRTLDNRGRVKGFPSWRACEAE